MNWIHATTDMVTNDGDDPAIETTNRFAGPYNAWGINESIAGLDISITSINTLISFQTSLGSLNNRY